jgi:transcriptional regulator GlxA family with amidase domain
MEEHVARLRVGFILTHRFTLTAYAGFVDALRLAADDGDRSQQRFCQWEILGDRKVPSESSCGAWVMPTLEMNRPDDFHYLVVVGGLLHGGQQVPQRAYAFLREAARRGVPLIGLCTGSFVLARAGLMGDYLACVSWFHRLDFEAAFPRCRATSSQKFIIDRDRLTCAGGTSVVPLAAAVIERSIGRPSAVKALRILIEELPQPSRMLQPEAALSRPSTDATVHKAMLLIEQELSKDSSIDELSSYLGIGRRQLERKFRQDIGLAPAEYRQKLRLKHGVSLLQHTDLGIMEIALQCGFQNSASFARATRSAFGLSPTALRREGTAKD